MITTHINIYFSCIKNIFPSDLSLYNESNNIATNTLYYKPYKHVVFSEIIYKWFNLKYRINPFIVTEVKKIYPKNDGSWDLQQRWVLNKGLFDAFKRWMVSN